MKPVFVLGALAFGAITVLAAPIDFTTPEGWTSLPASGMRKAQWSVPAAEGDTVAADVAVFSFGGGAGGVDANIERWKGQVAAEDGDPEAKVVKKTIQGLEVVFYDQQGKYMEPQFTATGMGKPIERKGWRIVNVLILAPDGTIVLRIRGPKKTVAANVAKFETMIETMILKDGSKPKGAEAPKDEPH